MILAFYSYKGGVGRTSLAVDTAVRLALGGSGRPALRTLIWDLDLDAPGVRHFPHFRPLAERATAGTNDLLRLLDADGRGDDVTAREVGRVLESAVVTDDGLAGGRLGLLFPAGAHQSEFLDGSSRFFQGGANGPALLALAAEVARQELQYDIVVVDARTGINELAGTATTVLADSAVLVFRMDGQDVAHLGDVSRGILDAWEESGVARSSRLYRVANLVPPAVRGTALAEEAQRRRDELAAQRLEPNIEMPLRPIALLREGIPALETAEADRTESDDDLAQWAYERWTEYVGRSDAPAAPSGGRRDEHAQRYANDVAALLQIAGWTVGPTPSGARGDLFAQRIEFGQKRQLVVHCHGSRRRLDAQDVLSIVDGQRGYADKADGEVGVMIVADRPSRSARDVAIQHDVLVTDTRALLDELAPTDVLRTAARQAWDGSVTERRYVAASGKELNRAGTPWGGRFPLEEAALSWVQQQEAGLLCVLGEFGSGKTTFCQRLARSVADSGPAPLLLEIRDSLSRGMSLEALIRDALEASGVTDPRIEAWKLQLRTGRAVLIIDGFDELIGYGEVGATSALLDEILAFASATRIVLTSRLWPFLHAGQRKGRRANTATAEGRDFGGSELWSTLRRSSSARIVEIQPFDDAQIAEYLANRSGETREASLAERYPVLQQVIDLLRRPYLLTLVVTSIDRWIEHGWPEEITLTAVYEAYLADWLTVETPTATGAIDAADIASRVAIAMLRSRTERLTALELRNAALGPESASVPALAANPTARDQAERLIRSAPFLVRDERGAYSFVHRSFLDFFVARAISQPLRRASKPDRLARALALPTLPPEVFVFLSGWPEAWAAVPGLCRQILQAPAASAEAAANGLLLLVAHQRAELGRREKIDCAGAKLDGAPLDNADLTNVNLSSASLRRASLIGATLVNADLGAADLGEASLDRANLRKASLRYARAHGASFAGADLRSSDFSHADIDEARLNRAIMRRAVMTDMSARSVSIEQSDLIRAQLTNADFTGAIAIGANFDSAEMSGVLLAGADLRFAKLRHADPPLEGALTTVGARRTPRADELGAAAAGYRALGRPHSSAVLPSLAGDQVLVGGHDGTIHSWDPQTDTTRAVYDGHTHAIKAIAVDSYEDGTAVAYSVADDKIHCWNRDTGTLNGVTELERSVSRLLTLGRTEDGTQLLAALRDDSEIDLVAPRDGAVVMRLAVAGVRDWCTVGPPDRVLLAVATTTGVALWDIREPGWTWVSSLENVAAICAFGEGLLAVTDNGQLHDIDVGSGTPRMLGETTAQDIAAMTVLTDADEYAVCLGSLDGAVWIWSGGYDVATTSPHDSSVDELLAVKTPDGLPSFLAVSPGDRATLYDGRYGRRLRELTAAPDVANAILPERGPDGQWTFMTGHDSGALAIWDLESTQLVRRLGRQGSWVSHLVPFAGDTHTEIASLDGSGHLSIWSPGARWPIDIEHEYELLAIAPVRNVSKSPLLGCVTDHGDVGVLNIDEHDWIWIAEGSAQASELTVDPEGRWLASVNVTGTVDMWDVERGALTGTFDAGGTRAVCAMKRASGPASVVTAGALGDIQVWDPQSGQLLTSLPCEVAMKTGQSITRLAPACEGAENLLIVALESGWVELWNIDNQVRVDGWRAHQSWTTGLAAVPTPGRPVVVAASEDGSISVRRDGSTIRLVHDGSGGWLACRDGLTIDEGRRVAWGSKGGLAHLLLVGNRWDFADVLAVWPDAVHVHGEGDE